MKRSTGVLMSISSLPSPYGIGCFDRAAYEFVDFLSAAGQRFWQILPLGATGYGDSPYQSFSTFAGNPYFIDLDALVGEGLITRDACERVGLNQDSSRVVYSHQYIRRMPLLREAHRNSKHKQDPAYRAFCESNPWLEDYALFMAIKDAHGGAPLTEWESDIRRREPAAMADYLSRLSDDMDFYRFIQYVFDLQWKNLKAYANRKGIFIIGDIPIYVSLDSADVWANPQLFQLDGELLPRAVAGCPPDGFSPDGQLWGNPLYDWQAHAEHGYGWWRRRIAHCLKLYDVVRIDHFRGFDEYYAIPYGQTTAHGGWWERGPGMELFSAMRDLLTSHGGEDIPPVIAEDLGFMTPSVRALVRDSGFPGMRVLQFGFDGRDSGGNSDNEHLPHNYPIDCVAYTGTHDNQTLTSWYYTVTDRERDAVRGYLGDAYPPDEPPVRRLIAALMKSHAQLCIVPMQDWLGLDDSARMNTPATVGHNWVWRMEKGALTPDLAEEMRQMALAFSRNVS